MRQKLLSLAVVDRHMTQTSDAVPVITDTVCVRGVYLFHPTDRMRQNAFCEDEIL